MLWTEGAVTWKYSWKSRSAVTPHPGICAGAARVRGQRAVPTATSGLEGGYEGNFGQIFAGNIKQQRKGRIDQKDSYVEITAADGDKAYNFSFINTSLPAGTTPTGVQKALLNRFKEYGVTEGYTPAFASSGCVRGKVLYGAVKDEAREFAKTTDCAWSIQDGALTFIPLTSYIPGEVLVVSPTTGLIGTPVQTANGISMRMLLNPSVKIGTAIKLENAIINQYRFPLDNSQQAANQLTRAVNQTSPAGLYYVMKAEHSDDTRGEDWYTDISCLSIDATVRVETTAGFTAGPGGGIRIFN